VCPSGDAHNDTILANIGESILRVILKSMPEVTIKVDDNVTNISGVKLSKLRKKDHCVSIPLLSYSPPPSNTVLSKHRLVFSRAHMYSAYIDSGVGSEQSNNGHRQRPQPR
jgi:hypothetical protein